MSDTEILINAVQERPILWDKRNKNYHNRLSSQREWENLATIIGTTVDVVKKKWKNLRDTFMKELKKIPKPRSGSDADNEPKYTGTWPYFEIMSFLTVVFKPRKTHGNIEPEDLTEDSIDLPKMPDDASNVDVANNDNTQLSVSILQDMDLNFIQPPSPSLPIPSPSAPTPSLSAPIPSPSPPTPSSFQAPANKKRTTKRKRQNDDLQAYMEIEKEKLKLLQEDKQDAHDDDLLWFKSILPYMKQLPAMNKLLFRTQMQEHLLNELTKLSPPQSDHHGYYTST